MKRGFTLIQLLVVIVLLFIIISIPVINIINKSKKKVLENAANAIIEAAEYGYVQDVLNGITEKVIYTYKNGVESSIPNDKILNYKGAKPQNGEIIVNSEGKVALAIHDGKYCAKKGFEDSQLTINSQKIDECLSNNGD